MLIKEVTDSTALAAAFAKRLTDQLGDGQPGVWLLSGGSCMGFEVAVSKLLPQMFNLQVRLADERYGVVGHSDSNWKQLTELGFAFEKFAAKPTLVAGESPEQTVDRVRADLAEILSKSTYTTAILGMGPDGHTAGLLPHSQPLDSAELYDHYQADPFHRLTITPMVFPAIDFALVHTSGDAKHKVLESITPETAVADKPVQLITTSHEYEIVNITKEPGMRIGFIGLGKMGSQIVTKLIKAGHSVVAYDPNKEFVDKMVAVGAEPATSRDDLVAKAGAGAVVWLMIPSNFVGDEVTALLEIMPSGMTLVDGGNTKFELTMERAKQCAEKGVSFIDVGTSGGILGLTNGFSMMVGGEPTKVTQIEPLLQVLAQPTGSYHHFGPAGAGHFVKMVHNGIEYGMMQAYAEGYRLLKETPLFPGLDLAAVAHVWQHGSIVASNLNGLVEQIYTENPTLDGVDGYVADSGEGRWTLEQAEASQIEMPVLRDAIDVRTRSQNGETNYATKLLASMRNAFGGHAINKQ